MRGLVRLRDGRIELLGGAPEGRDAFSQLVTGWAGWRRYPAAGRMPGGHPCSLFGARPWSSSIIPMWECKAITFEFQGETQQVLQQILRALERAKTELDPPPGHAAALRWTDEWRRQPMAHQVRAIRALEAMHFRALLADDMGLGKTATAIWAWQQSGAVRATVLCPKTVKRNWQREIEATLDDVQVLVVEGTARQRSDVFGFLRHHLAHPGGRCAAVINYDLLHRLSEPEQKVLREWAHDGFLICDESHYVKNRKAARTQFIFNELAGEEDGAAFRLCLSGTPVRNTLEDLWAQLHIVRPGIYSSCGQFDRFHLVRGKAEFSYSRAADGKTKRTVQSVVRGVQAKEQLNAIVNTCQVRRRKEDVLTLPEKVFSYPEFELDEGTAKVYRAMRDFALIELAELPDETNVFAPGAKSALEATLRLEQIAQGFLGGIPPAYLERVSPLIEKIAEKIEGREGHVMFPGSAKVEWLLETVESIRLQGGKPLVFSRFNTPMFWLAGQVENAAVLHGGLSSEQRDTILDLFLGGATDVLFCQVRLAEGWNAVVSQDVVFYGRDWSPAVNAQAVDRVHRIGQKGTVNVQVPIVEKTFEAYLHRKLAAKQRDADVALKALSIGELKRVLVEG